MRRYGLTAQEFEHTFVRLEQINRLQAEGLLDEHLPHLRPGRPLRVMAANPQGFLVTAPRRAVVVVDNASDDASTLIAQATEGLLLHPSTEG